MEKVVHKFINSSVEGTHLYESDGSIWLIFPEKKQWIVSFYSETNYLWYNYDFFSNLFRYLDLELGDNNFYIRKWVEKTLGFKAGKNCHPDYLPDEYDWRKDFDVEGVINDGIKL